jgi:hypothetical protein
MSYDIYCFRPGSATPSLEEAQAVIESEEALERPEDRKRERNETAGRAGAHAAQSTTATF